MILITAFCHKMSIFIHRQRTLHIFFSQYTQTYILWKFSDSARHVLTLN